MMVTPVAPTMVTIPAPIEIIIGAYTSRPPRKPKSVLSRIQCRFCDKYGHYAKQCPNTLMWPMSEQTYPDSSVFKWSSPRYTKYYEGIRGKYPKTYQPAHLRNKSGLWIYSFRVISWDPTDPNVPGTWS